MIEFRLLYFFTFGSLVLFSPAIFKINMTCFWPLAARYIEPCPPVHDTNIWCTIYSVLSLAGM